MKKLKVHTILQANGRQIVCRPHVSKRGKLYWRKRVGFSPRMKS